MVAGIYNADSYSVSPNTYLAFADIGICEEWGSCQINVCGFYDESVFEFAREHDIFPRKLIERDEMYEEYFHKKKEIFYALDDEIKESFDKTLTLLRELYDDFMFFSSPLFQISSEYKIWGIVTPYDVWCDEKNNKKAEGQP